MNVRTIQSTNKRVKLLLFNKKKNDVFNVEIGHLKTF